LTKEPVLPASQNNTEGIEAILSPVAKMGEKELPIKKKSSVLVVDDNDDIREILHKLLEYEDFTVFTAADGIAGMDVAMAQRPDLIIVDFNMPRLNGDQVIIQLRKQPEFATTPIIVVTAYGQWAAGPALQAGADRMMTKPLDPDQVVDAIRELLARTTAA
jgi:DNA-binding response OmpR family regulator